MTNNNTAASFESATALIAQQASLCIQLAAQLDPSSPAMTPGAAVDHVAQSLAERATDARTRTGGWAYETATVEIEDAVFLGSVARDVLDGKVVRPSVGNVREHTLSLL